MKNLMRKSEKLVFGTCYLEMCFDPCQRVIIRDLLPSSSSTMGEGMANPTQVLSPPLWRQEVSPKKGLSNPHGDQQPQTPRRDQRLGSFTITSANDAAQEGDQPPEDEPLDF